MFRHIVSAITVLFVLSAADARANYLFGLTERDIDEIMSHYYPKGYDRDAILRQMTAPFDCGHFGDLCREVGEDYAAQIVESAWIRARLGHPVETIDRAAREQFEALELRWFERNFPDGVADQHPYWGIFGDDDDSSCDDTVSAQKGDFRVTHTSRRHSLGLIGWGRVKVEHFKRNIWGNFKPERADRLEVEGIVFVRENGQLPTFNILLAKIEENSKQVSQKHTEPGIRLVRVEFVQGCGGVSGNEALTACSCSGSIN